MGKRKKNSRRNRLLTTSQEKARMGANIPLPDYGTRIHLALEPIFKPEDPRSLIPRSPEGSAGFYRVTFVLGTPGTQEARTHIDLDRFMKSGDSLIAVHDEIQQIEVRIWNDQEERIIYFSKNSRGRIAQAKIRLFAPHRSFAERYAYDLILPVLSWWSYKYDISLAISGYHILEEETDIESICFNTPGKIRVFQGDEQGLSHWELRPMLSAYREASNASNDFYKFLCYYKVIEGVYKLRNRKHEKAIQNGLQYHRPAERMPQHDSDLKDVEWDELRYFQPYLGKKFTSIRDDLRNTVRNALAHLDPFSEALVADRFDDLVKCEESVPVVRYISRVMLQRELELGTADSSTQTTPNIR